MLCISRSNVSDQMVKPSRASISSAVTRTRLRRAEPNSSTCATLSLLAISADQLADLNQNDERRAATRRLSILDNAVRISSAIPSLK